MELEKDLNKIADKRKINLTDEKVDYDSEEEENNDNLMLNHPLLGFKTTDSKDGDIGLMLLGKDKIKRM